MELVPRPVDHDEIWSLMQESTMAAMTGTERNEAKEGAFLAQDVVARVRAD